MNSFPDIIKNLGKFGLSEAQARIYLLLIKNGELRIGDIANATHIPRSSVYENLKPLFALGLVEKIVDDKFMRMKAYPVGSLRHGLNEKLVHIRGLISDVDLLEKTVTAIQASSSSPATVVRYYRGISGARQLLWNSLQAKSIVYVYSAFGRSTFVGKKFYSDFVRESADLGLKEKVIINPTKRAIELIKRDTGSRLARTNSKDIRFVEEKQLPIKGETFIYDSIYAQINLHAAEISGFEIESSDLSTPQRAIFEIIWKEAKPIFSRL